MEVSILQSSINVQELYENVSKCGVGSVSLYIGNKSEIFDRSVLGTVTGYSRDQVIVAFLTEVCREVKEKHCVVNITINCWLDGSDYEPCLAIACLAPSYQSASEAVKAAVDLINGSKPKLNSDDPVIDMVTADLIQVKASNEEINQRIQSFIERRREQVNSDNIRDFCSIRSHSDELSCARVNAVKIHRKDSKSHLRVRKVFNLWGPQTARAEISETNNRLDARGTDDPVGQEMSGNNSFKGKNIVNCSKSCKEDLLDERLRNVEEHIDVNAAGSSSDLYARLKKIEDKILYLEGLSPEYFEFWGKNSKPVLNKPKKNSVKKTYSSDELSKKIRELECNMPLE